MKRLSIINVSFFTVTLSALALTGCGRSADMGPVANLSDADAIRKVITAGKAEGGEKAAAVTGTGWATIRGQFVFDGTPPEMQPYNVTKEHEICSVNGKAPPQETLVVAPDSKGIKNV